MPRGGPRPGAGRKPLSKAGKVVTRQVTLTPERLKLWTAALEPHETLNEYMHEAGDALARRREALASEVKRRERQPKENQP